MEFKNIFVAVCDILGFKDFISNNTIEEIINIFEEFPEQLNHAVNLKDRGTGEPSLIVNFNLFSDTIVLWTDNNSSESLSELILVTNNLFNYSMQIGLPLRGAISIGDISTNSFKFNSKKINIVNSIIGCGLVNAYNIEGDQLWSGCVLDPMIYDLCDTHIKNYLDCTYMKKNFLKYNVPRRSTGCQEMIALNWVNVNDDCFDEKTIMELFSSYNKDATADDVKTKIVNTLKFYNFVKNPKNLEPE